MKDYIAVIKLDDISEEEYIKEVEEHIINRDKIFTVTPNLDGLRIAYKSRKVRRIINNADYSLIDGKPILWIAKWLKKKQFVHKISGSDVSNTLVEMAANKGYKIAIFGGKRGVAEAAKDNLIKKYPNLKVVYTFSPKLGYEKDAKLVKKYIQDLNDCHADIYFLCTGFPKTEKFFANHYDEFSSGLYMSVGATVDFWAGNVKRAPKWMSNHGLEWLYRLSCDFGRLFSRYWADFWFLIKMWFICHFHKKKFDKMLAKDKKKK